jgi:uncharacterized protein YcgI (DUF1989 family)
MTTYGEKREDFVIEPVSARALPVYKGEVIRIIQVGGEQCVDFNAFNLHDYKEYLGVSNTRSYGGIRPKKGDLVWSVHSRNRVMYAILEMSDTCVTDLLGGRCKAAIHYGVGFTPDRHGIHTNCQDTMAEAIGEYGLTPDDVHDSFNLWMNTEWDSRGTYWSVWNTGRPGDYVDLLAVFDTLAVPTICGSGDVGLTSNFSFKPIQVQVFAPSAETAKLADSFDQRYNQTARTLDDFRVKAIRTDRALERDPSYVPKFVNYPLTFRKIPVELSADEYAMLQQVREAGMGNTDAEALRAAFFFWYQKNLRPTALRGKVL